MADKPHPASGFAPTPGQSPATGGDAKPVTSESAPGGASPRAMAQRGSDARDAMAEMAERAQQISQEAGTKIAAAMKDVIGAASGIAGFAVESARDLVQYMVRRGQITHDEAEKLIRQAEDAHSRQARSGGGGGGAKAASDRSQPKAERPSREVAREETKPAASAAKRASGATAAAKPEKKQPAKRSGGAKKSAGKPSTPKKKR